METTEISKTHKDKSVFQTFSDFLKDVWKNDENALKFIVANNSFRTSGTIVT